MAILPLNQGGTGSDLSATGGANEFVKQTSGGANLSVAAIATADIASVGVVKNSTAAQTITGQPLTLSNTAPLMLATMEHIQYVDETLFRGGTDIGDEINRAYAALNTALATTAASVSNIGGTQTATLTMASNPSTFGFVNGQAVYVTGFSGSDTYLNGTFVLTGVTSTTVSYAVNHANATAASNGTVSFASGGAIYIAPKANGAAYGFTTSVIFGVSGKYVNLIGLAPPNQSLGLGTANSMGGVTLNFTPTSSTKALVLSAVNPSSNGTAVYTGTIDGAMNAYAGFVFQVAGFGTNNNNGYFVCTASTPGTTTGTLTLSNGYATMVMNASANAAQIQQTAITYANEATIGDGFARSQIMENICLVGGPITSLKNGGGPNSGYGWDNIGLDYSLAGGLQTRNVRICGFGVGKLCNNPVNGWGATDWNLALNANFVGHLIYNGMEDYGHIGGAMANNSIGFCAQGNNGNPGGDYTFIKISCDSNYQYGILSMAGGNQNFITTHGVHFENVGDRTFPNHTDGPPHSIPGMSTFYINNLNGGVSIHGGVAYDDNDNTCASSAYMFSQTGPSGQMFAYGLSVGGSSQALTNIFSCNGPGGFLSGTNTISGVTTSLFGGTGAPNVTSFMYGTSVNGTLGSNGIVGNNLLANGLVQTSAAFKQGTVVKINSSSTTKISQVPGFYGGFFMIRDVDHTGSAIGYWDGTVVVIVSSAAGTTVFVTGSPAATQIQLTVDGTLNLFATPGSSRSNTHLSLAQINFQ